MRMKLAGFSLVELVVAITIGGVVLSTVMVSYVSLAKMRQSLDISRQVQRELNFATMRISDRARANSINYEKLDSDNHHFLPLGEDEFIYDDVAKSLSMNGAPLFSPNIMVEQAEFDVWPINNDPKVQPMVNLQLLVSSKNKPDIEIPLRTSISSRVIR